MNHNQRHRWLRERLSSWGEWRVRGVKGLGYPSMTPEAKLYYSPGRGSQQAIAPEYRVDAQALEIDKAIQRIESKHQLALWAQYVQNMKRRKCLQLFELSSIHEWHRLLEKAERELAKLLPKNTG